MPSTSYTGAPPGRLVTKANTSGETLLAAATVPAAPLGSFGSWVQLTASTATEYAITSIGVTTGTTFSSSGSWPVLIEIGTGASGSETTLGRRSLSFLSSGSLGTAGLISLSVPWRVTAGTRLVARATNQSGATTATLDVEVSVVPWASLEGN